jgi:hypothetical protein
MKKKNLNSLPLKKTRISNLKNTHVLGGNSKKCYHTIKLECNTKTCSSTAFQDCTVTYAICETEPRFCGAF